MNREQLAKLLDPQQLQLILLPTEDCNFRCTYCYEDFAIGRMSRATVDAVKKLIERRIPKLRDMSIGWFGGEPLIAKDIVLEINAFAKECAERAGIPFHSSMSTNAFTLGRQTFRTLLEHRVVSFQISIDGNEEEHDKTRKQRSGKGTFQEIWSNLQGIHATEGQFQILLRVHVHLENFDSVRALLVRIHDEFGADRRFDIALNAVGNWGGQSVLQMNLLKNASEAIAQLQAHLRELGWYVAREKTELTSPAPRDEAGTEAKMAPAVGNVGQSSALDPKQEVRAGPVVPDVCYAARPNSFVIRADGTLAKCTVAFSDARNKLGKITADGTLSLDNSKMQRFMRGFQSMDEDELRCPIQNMPAEPTVHPITVFPRQAYAPELPGL